MYALDIKYEHMYYDLSVSGKYMPLRINISE